MQVQGGLSHKELSLLFKEELREHFTSVMERGGVVNCYRAGEIIFYPEMVRDRIFYILKGLVHLSMSWPDGSQKIFAMLKPGEIFGEMSFIDRHNEYTAMAILDCEILTLNVQDVFSHLSNGSSFLMSLITALSRRVLLIYRQLELSIFADSRKALVFLLYQLAKHYSTPSKEGKVISLSISQEELSHLIGTSRVTVNCLLKELVQQGILEMRYRKIIILDDQKLKDLFIN